jgi:poly(3-hydroxybutyrate) depolymerase
MTESQGYATASDLRFLEFVPSDSTSCGGCVVYLHGAGERGTDLSSVKRYGLPAVVASGQVSLNFHLICPQLEAEREWQPDRIAELLTYMRRQFGLVGLLGYSLGGQGVCEVLGRHGRVSEFAVAIAGRAQSQVSVSQRGVSFLGIAGEHDSWASMSSFVEGVNAAGGRALEVTLPGHGHYTSEVALEQPALQAMLATTGFALRFAENVG